MSEKPPILHILFVGFHHKFGCQIGFSYPPLIVDTEDKNECPSGWKYLPYLSLQYMDLLSDPSVLSYVIGTSNVLFQQKRNLADRQVDVENCTIETHEPDLRKQLSLNTEDLSFMDYLMRHVQNPKEDAQCSEFWTREQFQGYMLSPLRTAVIQDSPKDCDHFNSNFMLTFKRTQCFQEWYDVRPEPSFFSSGHMFAWNALL